TTFSAPSLSRIYALSLHDALPIYVAREDVVAEHLRRQLAAEVVAAVQPRLVLEVTVDPVEVERDPADATFGERDPQLGEPSQRRSEEHTSELQSLRHLVCRLLLEK